MPEANLYKNEVTAQFCKTRKVTSIKPLESRKVIELNLANLYNAPCHGWSYWKYLYFACVFSHVWNHVSHKNLRNHWNSIGNTRNAAHWHQWNYSKNLCFIAVLFHFWNHEFMLICKNVVFQMKFQQFCSFMSVELFKKAMNSWRVFNTFELVLTSDFRKS